MYRKKYSPEYYQHIILKSKEWQRTCRITHGLNRGYCVVFFWIKSFDCHHLTYANMKARKELPIRDTVPLSRIAHTIIHKANIFGYKLFWVDRKPKAFRRRFWAWVLRFLYIWSILWHRTIGLLFR